MLIVIPELHQQLAFVTFIFLKSSITESGGLSGGLTLPVINGHQKHAT